MESAHTAMGLSIFDNTVQHTLVLLYTHPHCCECNTQCTYRVYIKYTGLGEEHARRQWMGSLKIALTQKIMQPRTKIWLLVFELSCVKCLLYCNTTKRFRVQRNCDYAYLCVYSTHIWHLKCSGHGCQYIFHLTILVVDWFSAISDKCRCRLWNHLCRVVVINLKSSLSSDRQVSPATDQIEIYSMEIQIIIKGQLQQ